MSRFLWTQKQDIGPSPRVGHSLAYDSDRGRVVLFGGDSLRAKLFADTWEWDGADWTQVADIGPSSRANHAVAYDSTTRQVVLFGGDTSLSVAQDTWGWDGEDWTQLADSGPLPRAGHAMAFDSQRNRTVLFGGQLGDGRQLNDTWEWDGDEWTQQEDTGPSPRTNHAIAYDSRRGRVVLFGGQADLSGLGDTWEWDGTTWTQRSDFGPDAALGGAMASQGGNVLTFGGVSAADPQLAPVLFGRTWEWDGKHWTQRQDIGPGPRWRHAMAFDGRRGRVVLFGGLSVFAPNDPALPGSLLGDTWEHRVSASLESLVLSPAVASPSERIVATASLSAPAPAGGFNITVVAVGQPVSNELPAVISIPENALSGQLTFFVQLNVASGVHSIVAMLGEAVTMAPLTIR